MGDEHHDHSDRFPDFETLIGRLGHENAKRVRAFLRLNFTSEIPYTTKELLKEEYSSLKEIIRANLSEAFAEYLIDEVLKPVYKKLKERLEA